MTITYYFANRTDKTTHPFQGTSRDLPTVNADTLEEAIDLAGKVVETRKPGACLQMIVVGDTSDTREIVIGNDGREVRVNEPSTNQALFSH